jgi:hypothetical protein
VSGISKYTKVIRFATPGRLFASCNFEMLEQPRATNDTFRWAKRISTISTYFPHFEMLGRLLFPYFEMLEIPHLNRLKHCKIVSFRHASAVHAISKLGTAQRIATPNGARHLNIYKSGTFRHVRATFCVLQF